MSHRLSIGTIEGTLTPAELDARRLNRHTFRCEQSGSGITCALGALPRAVALDHRWEKPEEPRPLLVVIDEAHNVRASDPVTPVQRELTERVTRMAATGRALAGVGSGPLA
ncbi:MULTISPECIES: hypothetical protein [unclassified Arthrobacter]|uniref:hypothetical protein n=1 Tax=unclassified Arthrobacter TaxID=235627 RepID=UPI002E09BBD1|nr:MULTISPECIES: hypothetical protein [unclassified Arthrobacter]MEC5191300.1 hypothetical protein [Arthrobacter sp. MP_M4]MEC5202949.1 hypothetical protein [Arthrobacter sp. MP_M7]